MSHEARDVLRIFYKLREKVPQSIPDQLILNMLQVTIRNLRNYSLDDPIQCVRCGKCCTSSGHITMSEEELSLIKAYLKENGSKKRLHPMPDQDIITLNGIPCPLYDKKTQSCTVYTVRPQVCNDFPREYLRRRARASQWPLVSFCVAADDLVIKQVLRDLEKPPVTTLHQSSFADHLIL